MKPSRPLAAQIGADVVELDEETVARIEALQDDVNAGRLDGSMLQRVIEAGLDVAGDGAPPSGHHGAAAVCRYRSVMATTKTKSTDKKTDKKNKNAETKSSPKSGSEGATSAAKLTRKLLDKLSPIGATTRAALRALATDAQRSELGHQTKARGVLADGVTMAISIDQQINTFPGLTEIYVLPRFAYFLESLLALDALIG